MVDRSLLMLLGEVRGRTLTLLSGVTDEQARWAPPGLQNTILWQAGHCYVVPERLIMGAAGLPAETPAGWFGVFDLVGFPKVREWEEKYLSAEQLERYSGSLGLYEPGR